jgi:hypothetical protein
LTARSPYLFLLSVGLDARWLDLVCKHSGLNDVPPRWTIQLNWLDQEYWSLVKCMVLN